MLVLWSLCLEKPWRIVVRTTEEFRKMAEGIRRRGELPDLTNIETAGETLAWLPELIREAMPERSIGIFCDSQEDAAVWYERRCRERKKQHEGS